MCFSIKKKPATFGIDRSRWLFMLVITLIMTLSMPHAHAKDGIKPDHSMGKNLQQPIVKGTVTDSTGTGIAGATVKLEGTAKGTVTNTNGEFSLDVAGGSALLISYIGYVPQRIAISGRSVIHAVLLPDAGGLDEVVVVGYGTQKKADITGAISTVSGETLKQGISQSAAHSLQGRAPGVTVIQNSGEPGAGVEIRIRGSGSINDNSPLYVIDGVIADGLSGLNPADIADMSLLKDASSAAIYGARGANGVVIVTTKKGGRNQKTSTSFNTSQGLQQAWRMPTALTAEERNTIHKEALTNDGTPTTDPIWNYYNDPENAVTRTDWFKEVLRSAYTANHDLAVRGGSDKSNYSFSLGMMDDNGIVKETDFKRYNVRFNSQHEIAKGLVLGENISAYQTDQKAAELRGDYDGILSAALYNFRNIPVYEDKANQVYGAPSGDFPNPVASLNSRDNTNKSANAGGNVYLEYKFLNLFTAKSDIAYTWGFNKNKNFVATATNGGRGLTENSLSENHTTSTNWIWNNTLNIDKSIGKHHIGGLIGMSAEEGKSEDLSSGTAKGFSNQDPDLRYFNNASIFQEHPGGGADDYSLASYFARVNYEFDQRYLLTANFRRDGSSKFAPDNRWGNFPSVSGGWRVSQEPFFAAAKHVVSDFKLRASWGQLGNDKINNYQYYSTVSSVGSPTLNGVPFTAVAQNRLANNSIKWEVTTQTDVGLDLGFLQDRLTVNADYYKKRTSDILVQVPLVSSYGVGTAPYRNAGVVTNNGYELAVTFRGPRANKFGYEISANVAHVKNELESLGVEGAKEIFTSNYKNTNVGRIAEGEPIGHFYVLDALGLFQSQAEIDSYTNKDGGLIQPYAKPGDVKFRDTNGDGVIGSNDRINAGNSFPKFTYSLNASANYGGFDFSMLWSGSQGNNIFNGMKLGGMFLQGASYNNSPEILDRWTPDHTNTNVPRVTMTDLNQNRTYSTLYIEDGSYLRLKYLTFGYTFTEHLIRKSISRLRAFVTLQNLVTITDYSGFDPEIGADVNSNRNMYGVDRGGYPQAKAYIFGVNFDF